MKEEIIFLVLLISILLSGCDLSSSEEDSFYLEYEYLRSGPGTGDYKITINSEGILIYNEENFYAGDGINITKQLIEEEVNEIIKVIKNSNFFTLPDRIRNDRCLDGSEAKLSITLNNDKKHTVVMYHCANSNRRFENIEKKILEHKQNKIDAELYNLRLEKIKEAEELQQEI
ncbi:MAG: hypothetical protein HYS32_00205 [Candidatus Woesearchaeota archaeon]|nr:MAG: hypothetical protein HYS32_00205 [Candidatus Woesearchaeota archaeon]